MRICYIGGSGNISFDCIHESVRAGHDVSVFNRGNHNAGLPPEVTFIKGDVNDDATYSQIAGHHFDVICQFRLYDVEHLRRDLHLFTGHCGHYVFISTASAYRKPTPGNAPITEDTPLANPYAEYSQNKADVEHALRRQDKLPFTIVRPNLTYRLVMPLTALSRPLNVSRLLRGKPVVVHGDGQSLWTVTHAEDFAVPFVRLLQLPGANEAYHITHDGAWTWDELLLAGAAALGVEPTIVHVSSDALVRYKPAWRSALHGDKTPTTVFDNTKVKRAVGDFACRIDPWEGMKRVAQRHPVDPGNYDHEEDALYDRIVAEQRALGD